MRMSLLCKSLVEGGFGFSCMSYGNDENVMAGIVCVVKVAILVERTLGLEWVVYDDEICVVLFTIQALLDDVEFSYLLLKVVGLESKETNEEGGEVSLGLNTLFGAGF